MNRILTDKNEKNLLISLILKDLLNEKHGRKIQLLVTFSNKKPIIVISYTYIPCILTIIEFFFSPTDAQYDSLKNNFKFPLKLTSKRSFLMSILMQI